MSTAQDKLGASKMTPEQKAIMRNFGKKNGLTEQKIQSQLPQKTQIVNAEAKTVRQPVQQHVQQPVQQPVQQYVQQPVQRPMLIDDGKESNENDQTYFSYEDEGGGKLEIDLITFREKGLETRYLSFAFSGTDVRQDPPIQQEAFLNIETKEAFEQIKFFFSQLNWED